MSELHGRAAALLTYILTLLAIALLASKYTSSLEVSRSVEGRSGPLIVGNLSVHISAEPRDITINETSIITITVTMGSTPIPGALVKLSCSRGTLSRDSGLTDSEGRLVALFTSNSPGIFVIYAKASKDGYKPGINFTRVNVTVHPRPSGNATSTKEAGTGETKKEASTEGTTGNTTSTEVIGDKLAGVTSSGCKKCSGGSTGRTRVFDDGF
ncbi:MAG: Ig-like domain-containing protein, partial [Thermofilaceae archaeon]